VIDDMCDVCNEAYLTSDVNKTFMTRPRPRSRPTPNGQDQDKDFEMLLKQDQDKDQDFLCQIKTAEPMSRTRPRLNGI